MISLQSKGFTHAEILVAIAIFAALLLIGTLALTKAKNTNQLSVIGDSIAYKLDEQRVNAFSGKNGSAFGVYFDSGHYTAFIGSTYNSASASNTITTLPSGYYISGISPASGIIVFNRVTGAPNVAGSVTIASSFSSSTITVTIGSQGEVAVTKL